MYTLPQTEPYFYVKTEAMRNQLTYLKLKNYSQHTHVFIQLYTHVLPCAFYRRLQMQFGQQPKVGWVCDGRVDRPPYLKPDFVGVPEVGRECEYTSETSDLLFKEKCRSRHVHTGEWRQDLVAETVCRACTWTYN